MILNESAIVAAEARAARFLLQPHSTAEARADSKAEAVQLLEQATEALRLAGKTALALQALELRQKAEA